MSCDNWFQFEITEGKYDFLKHSSLHIGSRIRFCVWGRSLLETTASWIQSKFVKYTGEWSLTTFQFIEKKYNLAFLRVSNEVVQFSLASNLEVSVRLIAQVQARLYAAHFPTRAMNLLCNYHTKLNHILL